MAASTPTRQVMIIAGEASGDMHGARLVRAMQELEPGLRFCGMGGRELAVAGVELLYDASRLAVVGVTEVLGHLGDILAARRILLARMRSQRPDLLILIDYPDFNLLLAAKARKLGIPIFYYISPQVWAWRSGRVKKIGRLADRIGVILPFEQEFYARRGVQVDFVGHPLMDAVETTMSRQQFLARHHIKPDRKIIGLLPGSRRREIASLLPDFLAAAERLARGSDKYVFLLPRASTVSRRWLDEHGLGEYGRRLCCQVVDENRYDLMAACDAVVAASGTVTLELAILGTPAVVTYRVSPRTYLLGRLLIRNIEFFSLVNLVAGREVVPELLQDQVTPENIAAELKQMTGEAATRDRIRQGLAEVTARLGGRGASRRAARIALETAARTP